ncbi:hypothetical protein BC343_16310 [Mucilaginibacter pedocola]|uniref:Glycosyltransferase 2-like domain-containing protein n=2 Tax=Mucilaginibacter pedocola TaxID=1792845 RepID=A0A1S9P8E7_9SPHI|nr:hypothetical protein BC343_16310 [Mucilaginibacter pedocola]
MISIIIPCYNAENFVARAIKSALEQTYRETEIILVDNNSQDNTKAVLEGFCNQYPDKITVLEQPKKGGGAARNMGLHHAKGTWIQFLDADDEILPDKLERQVKLIAKESPQLIVGNFDRVINAKGLKLRVSKKPNSKNIWHGLITARLGITSANLWEKKAVSAVSGWDERLSSSQEYDLIFRMLQNNAKVAFDIARTSALIHYGAGSITRSKNTEKVIEVANNYLNLRLRIKEHLTAIDKLDKRTLALLNLFMYAYLTDRRAQIPEYVNEKLKQLDIRLSLGDKFSQLRKYYIKRAISMVSR